MIILIVWRVLQDKILWAENYLSEKNLSYLNDKIKHHHILDMLFMSVIPRKGTYALGETVRRRHHAILSKISDSFSCNQALLPEIIFFLLLMASWGTFHLCREPGHPGGQKFFSLFMSFPVRNHQIDSMLTYHEFGQGFREDLQKPQKLIST